MAKKTVKKSSKKTSTKSADALLPIMKWIGVTLIVVTAILAVFARDQLPLLVPITIALAVLGIFLGRFSK